MHHGGWVFGYGSLMWAPEFPVAEQVIAQADGWRRSFCLRSIQHRGTAEAPGLVLGLEAQPGHLCTGLALRVEAPLWPEVHAALRARELVTEAYREALVPLALADGRRVEALTGQAATQLDFRHAIEHGLPWVLGTIVAATFILLFLMTGSVLVPLKAVVINSISLAASTCDVTSNRRPPV